MASSLSQAALFSIFLLLSLHQACCDFPGEKKTHLRVYLHEVLSGANATVLQNVNAPNSTSFTFGAMQAVDDILREGPNENSTLVGRAQGIHASVSKEGLVVQTIFDIVFTEGKYNGSTLAVFGSITLGKIVERPVIGGTGQFRMATGYCLATPIVSTATKQIYEFDVYVWHH